MLHSTNMNDHEAEAHETLHRTNILESQNHGKIFGKEKDIKEI